MPNLLSTEKLVLQVLEEQPKTREDDYLLMLFVTAKINIDLLNQSFSDVMLGRHNNGLPNWETVTRCRRKIQEKNPHLRNEKKAIYRKIEEQKYIEYSRL